MAGATAHYCSEKDAGEKKVVSFAAAAIVAALLLSCAIALTAAAPRPPDTLEQLQEKFDKETDGVRKAKQIQRLGDAQFTKEREAAKAGDFVTAGVVMEKYRDNVRAALEALKKTRPDAEKHSNGYKQLEFHAGQGLREVRDVILAMPEPLRPPMQIVEKDLREIDQELLKLLFPRRPGEQPPMQPRASTTEKDAKPEKQP
jgi:hypothetical protein